MTDKLPPQLLNLFAPRPPLRYLLPHDSAPESRKTPIVSGLAHFLSEFNSNDNDYVPTDTAEQLKEKRRAAKQARNQKMFRDGIENYDPASDPQVRGDPFCTLFVSRLSYDTTEHDLERAFGTYGPIERIRIVRNKENNKQRGYAFIVFEHERDMKKAYKEAFDLKIRDRRLIVDIERGRTIKGWRPRRLGGGAGGRGYTKEHLSARGARYDRSHDRGPARGFRSNSDSRGGYRGDWDRDRDRDRGDRDYDRSDRDSDRGEYRSRGYRGGFNDRRGGGGGGGGGAGDRGGGFGGGSRGGGFRSGGDRGGRYGGIGYRGGGFGGNANPPSGPAADFPVNAPTGPSGGGVGYQNRYSSGPNNVPVGGGGGGGGPAPAAAPSGFVAAATGRQDYPEQHRGGYEDRHRHDDRDYRSHGGRERSDRNGARSSHRREYEDGGARRQEDDRSPKRRKY